MNEMNGINVLVVDNDQITGDMLTVALKAMNFTVVKTATCTRRAAQILSYTQPDVILLDFLMLDFEREREITEYFKALSPSSKIICMVVSDEPLVQITISCANVDGIINKKQIHELPRVVNECNANNIAFPSSMLRLTYLFNKSLSILTTEEREMVPFLLRKKSTFQIANILNLTDRSVRSRKKAVYEKLGKSLLGGINQNATNGEKIHNMV
jgi:DNA-binding NarL/FixJ family response regulator